MPLGSLDGWLTTKKRGRDDDKIEQDKQRALEERKARRSNGGARAKKKPSATASRSRRTSTNTKKRVTDDSWSDDDDGYDEVSEADSFIVGDDDEIEMEEDDDDDASFSEDEVGFGSSSFLPNAKKRSSRAMPYPQQKAAPRGRGAKITAKAVTAGATRSRFFRNTKTSPSAAAPVPNNGKRTTRGGNKKKPIELDVFDDSEEGSFHSSAVDDESDAADSILEDDGDDDDDFVSASNRRGAATAVAAGKKKQVQKPSNSVRSKKPPPPNSRSRTDDGSRASAPAAASKKKQKHIFLESSDDDDEDDPNDTNNDDEVVFDDDDEDEDELLNNKRMFKNGTNGTNGTKQTLENSNHGKASREKPILLDGGDDVDGILDDSPAFKSKSNGQNEDKGRNAKRKAKERIEMYDDFGCDNDDEAVALAAALEESRKMAERGSPSSAENRDSIDLLDDDEQGAGGLEDTPVQAPNKRKKLGGAKRRAVGEASRLMDSLHSEVTGKRISKKTYGFGEVRYDESDDEAKMVELNDTDDENDGNDDEQDDYIDEDAREAGSVLDTANQLSARVLQTMIQWRASGMNGSSSGTGNSDDGSSIPMGMIVDGALSLTSIQAGPTTNIASSKSPTRAGNKKGEDQEQEHSWIPHEVFKKLCPTLTLSEYQLVGVNWLALLHSMKCRVKQKGSGKEIETNVNGVLADEMGLGKTVQTISFLSWLAYTNRGKVPDATPRNRSASSPSQNTRKKKEAEDDEAIILDDSDEEEEEDEDFVMDAEAQKKPQPSKGNAAATLPHLIVAPASVLSNWEREFVTFAPHLNVVKFHGSQQERNELKRQLRLHLPGKENLRKLQGSEPLDAILAPVTYFQKENSDDRAFLRKFKYDYMVVDEAHSLKNARGLRYKSLNRFNTEHRLLLTGTPVQNSPKELMCLLCFLMPLFSRKASASYEDDEDKDDGGERMLQHFVSIEGQNGATSDETAYRKLKQLFAPFVLRRKKVDVLSQIMPPKTHRTEFVELDSYGRSLYDSILAEHVRSKNAGESSSERDHLFTQLRKAAHHPLLIRARYKSAEERDHLARCFKLYGAFRGEGCTHQKVLQELEKYNDFDIHLMALELVQENEQRRAELGRYILTEDDLFKSAKFVRLRTLLPQLVRDGHRILIFSVWTTCLDLLSCLLENLGMEYLRMEGSTPVGERQALIDRFNNEPAIPVFLLSTNACGLGINLTSADTCIMHDLHFNPFNDLQAEDRCHRIGQKKPVTVIKMVTKNTVDDDIFSMQERKVKMNAAIMENNASSSNKWDGTSEKEAVLKTALARFMASPQNKTRSDTDDTKDGAVSPSEKENKICLV